MHGQRITSMDIKMLMALCLIGRSYESCSSEKTPGNTFCILFWLSKYCYNDTLHFF